MTEAWGMTNDEGQMTKECLKPNDEAMSPEAARV